MLTSLLPEVFFICYSICMRKVEIIPIEPAYKKDNGMLVFGVAQYDAVIDFPIKERSIIHMPPQQLGGNHSHHRTEAFIALGENTEFHWIDDNEEKHVEPMNPESRLQVVIVYPGTPHAIRNNSDSLAATIIEYATAPQALEDVTREQVI